MYAINKNTNYKISIEEYKELTEEEQKEYIVKSLLQFFNVFNIKQKNIDEKDPERWQNILDKYQDDEEFIANEQKGIEIESIENMILSQSWYCPINIKISDSAFYVPYFNYIEVPLKKQFESNEAFYCTLLHEMAHSTGHKNLLNRLEISEHSKQNYAIEELTAEMTASFTALELGVSNTLREENAKYLKSCCNALKAEPTIILIILADVIKSSKLILERLEENNSNTKKIA